MRLFTVAQLNTYLRALLESDEVVRDIWVQGEISNFSQHSSSGHCYFRLKGENAVLDAVMWSRNAARLDALPRNGDAVLAHGYISFYEPSGKLQLYTDILQPAGVGLLHARFEELKQRLETEGLFDLSRKRALPALPRRIGVATSAQAAALRDILNVLGRRYPLVEVLVAPCLVQGDQAPDSIVEALYTLYAADVDLIILARGGGSIEDLWAFNEEVVARAVFASPVPLITGVGHETDTTIVDYVADLRAPTPSAAAELAVPDRAELDGQLDALRSRLNMAMAEHLGRARRDVAFASDALRRQTPLARLLRNRQQVDDLIRRASTRLDYAITLRRERLHGLHARLDTLSPLATLERGYAIVSRSDDGTVLLRADQVVPGDALEIRLRSGQVTVEVTHTE